jgi:hypothetical protein
MGDYRSVNKSRSSPKLAWIPTRRDGANDEAVKNSILLEIPLFQMS